MPHHVVVDGSNIATEGRERPSLRQLNEAVMAFMEEHPEALITVVVDATFGHRIDPKEASEFDEAVNNNELVAPPAGAIGRGDAFVLSIANKVNATILTNDSYQEFHGEYDWLFDEGRLIGGKPVPHIGWVFVNRLPVRGPISRKSTSEAKKRTGRGKAAETGTVRVGSAEASQPMPVPSAPPPGAVVPGRRPAKDTAAKDARTRDTAPKLAPAKESHAKDQHGKDQHPKETPAKDAPARQAGVNDLLSFLTFVERHPPGTSVNAIVDHYSSHGAYVKVGDVTGYVPLRLMADPAPRSAREFMKVGEAITLVVEKFVAEKRSIDLAVPGVGTALMVEAKPAKPRRATKKAAEAAPAPEVVAEPAPAKPKRVSKKAAAAAADVDAVTPAAPAEPAEPPAKPARKAAAKKAAPGAKKASPVAKKAAAAPQPATVPEPAAVKPAAKAAAKKAAPAKRVAKKA